MTCKGCTEYPLNDYNAVKKNNEPDFIYNNFKVSEKSINKI